MTRRSSGNCESLTTAMKLSERSNFVIRHGSHRSMARRLTQAGPLALVLSLGGRAAADVPPGSARFSYSSPVAAGCASEVALKAAIADGLGTDPFKSPEQSVAHLSLSVAIRRESAAS